MGPELGRLLAGLGLLLVIVGALLMWAPSIRLGHLPGDFVIPFKNGRLYLPLGTCLVLSVLLTLVLGLVNLLRR
jgi:hypothetical protein